jgi:hypothetical protein
MSKISMLCQAFFLVSILTVWFDVYIGRCGSQRVSMMSQAQQLFTGSASKSVYFIGAVLLSRPCHVSYRVWDCWGSVEQYCWIYWLGQNHVLLKLLICSVAAIVNQLLTHTLCFGVGCDGKCGASGKEYRTIYWHVL